MYQPIPINLLNVTLPSLYPVPYQSGRDSQGCSREKSVKIQITPSNLAKARQAFGTLPDEERAVLMLVCAERLSYQDAAEKLSISQAELRSRLLRARMALMNNLSAPTSLFDKRKPDFLPATEVACLPAREF
jgi:predicted DNA-binding protein (UPF0251 family)